MARPQRTLAPQKAPEILQFTETRRQELLSLGKKSLFFFTQAILGYPDLEAKPHLDLCENLDGRGTWGDWRRGMVCASRGFFKSTICTIAWPVRQALYNQNWSARLIGASYENTKRNFYDKVLNTFTQGPRREFLLWLYGDRFYPNFEGCNEHQFLLRNTDPLANAALTFKGAGSDQEGWHGNAVIVDDPEGAESEKGTSGNEDAYRTVGNAVPLLINPMTGNVLVVLTPHGGNPLAYRILESEPAGFDNSKRNWKIWWMPIVDAAGEPNFPARFDKAAINFTRTTTPQRVFDQQYLLQKVSAAGNTFNWPEIEAAQWKWAPGMTNRLIEYPVLEMDAHKWYGDTKHPGGEYAVERKTKKIGVEELRYYMHIDPVHKADPISQKMTGTARPSKAAIVITGVSPDFHVFVMSCWTAQVELAEQVRQAYKGYRLFGPHEISFDPIGAQVWFKDYCVMLERSDPRFQQLDTLGIFGHKKCLPRLSARLVEDKRPAGQPKEDTVADRLNPWFGSWQLHMNVNMGQDELRIQLQGFPDNCEEVDLVDALAQGPPLWKPPLGKQRQEHVLRTQQLTRRMAANHTGYVPPFSRGPAVTLLPESRLLKP